VYALRQSDTTRDSKRTRLRLILSLVRLFLLFTNFNTGLYYGILLKQTKSLSNTILCSPMWNSSFSDFRTRCKGSNIISITTNICIHFPSRINFNVSVILGVVWNLHLSDKRTWRDDCQFAVTNSDYIVLENIITNTSGCTQHIQSSTHTHTLFASHHCRSQVD